MQAVVIAGATAGRWLGFRRPALCGLLALLCVVQRAAAQAEPATVTQQERSPGQGTRFARYFRPGSADVIVGRQNGPAAAQRRLRGDWEPIDLLVLVNNPDWEPALRIMAERAATRVPVEVLVTAQDAGAARLRAWSAGRCVDVSEAQLDTPWIRDYGPMQVFDGGQVTWLDYDYYPSRERDDRLPGALAGQLNVPVEAERSHVDGGALVSNGRGLCAMTDVSLGDAGVIDRLELERFAARLGCRGLAVLPALIGEQTGHADVSVQFLAPDLVAVAAIDPAASAQNAERLDLAVGALRRVASALALPLRVLRIPMPTQGNVFYSYLNATRVHDLLFVPDYRAVDPKLQADAHARLRAALPEVTLVAVPADVMVPLGGAIHCITLGLNVREALVRPPCAHAAASRLPALPGLSPSPRRRPPASEAL